MVIVVVEGVEEIDAIANQLRAKMVRIWLQGDVVVKASALQVEALAKLFAPVDTGHLKSTIGSQGFRMSRRAGAIESAIAATARYAAYVEFGTRNMAPQPYMGPALDLVDPQFVAAVTAISDPLDG